MSRIAAIAAAMLAMLSPALASRASENEERSQRPIVAEAPWTKAPQNVETARGEPFERVLMGLEQRQAWRTISWRDGIQNAIAEAKTSGKPIAVVLFLEEYGQCNAPIS
jgi:hypothetical protein